MAGGKEQRGLARAGNLEAGTRRQWLEAGGQLCIVIHFKTLKLFFICKNAEVWREQIFFQLLFSTSFGGKWKLKISAVLYCIYISTL